MKQATYLKVMALSIVWSQQAQSANQYKVEVKSGTLEVRDFGSAYFRKVENHIDAESGATLRLSRQFPWSTPKIEIKQSGFPMETFVFVGEQIFRLPSSLEHSDQYVRETVKDASLLPSLNSSDRQVTNSQRLMTLVEGIFSKQSQNSEKSISNRDALKKFTPILPLYPGTVEIIETNTLPLSLDVAWEVKQGQVEPHGVYLWDQSMPAYSPYIRSAHGEATIQISKHGTYYWQIQDASGAFVSAPRTLLVKPVTTQSYSVESSSEDLINFVNLKPNSFVAGCFPKSPNPWFYARVVVPAGVEELRIESKPPEAIEPTVLKLTAENGTVSIQNFPIRPKKDGPFVFRLTGFSGNQPNTTSELIPIKFERVCGANQEQRLWKRLEDNFAMLSPGAIILVP